MKVVIATPLYPPDIAEPAPYSKELARRLSSAHEVTVLAYGYLPETIPGVTIQAINKRLPLPLRLLFFTVSLIRAAQKADLVYAENGPSVALPAAIAARLVRTPFVMHVGDRAAHEHGLVHALYGLPERSLQRAARTIVEDLPLPRPEVLPFNLPSAVSPEAYEASWEKHLILLEAAFSHA